MYDLPEANEFFDSDWYLDRYPDVVGMDPWEHFVHFGDAERRSPGPDFDARFYADTYLSLEEGAALQHYLAIGRAAGCLPRAREISIGDTREAINEKIAGMQFPVVLVGNDAQRAGAPLLLLELARHLRHRGFQPVIVLLRGGPLRAEFEAIGPTVMLAEGYHLDGLRAAIPIGTAIVGNTVLSAPVLQALIGVGPQVLLVHEMPEFIRQEGLMSTLESLSVIAASFPGMTAELTQMLSPGVQIVTVQPALMHVTVGPQSTRRVAELIRSDLGDVSHVYLGAGYADRRKGFDRFVSIAQDIALRDSRSGFIWLGELSDWAQEIAEAARASGLRLMLPGFRRDAAAWYDNVDVYLLTSRQDPGPTTAMDAARRGVPFVAAPGDLGIYEVREQLTRAGVFCTTDAETAEQALATAESDHPSLREHRAAHIEQFADFPRYLDEIIALLAAQS